MAVDVPRARRPGLAPILKSLAPFFLGALCLWLVAQRCHDVSLDALRGALRGIPLRCWALAALLDRLCARTDSSGLRQFKAAFAPRWQTRYLAAPANAALLCGAWDVLRNVRARPMPPPADIVVPFRAT